MEGTALKELAFTLTAPGVGKERHICTVQIKTPLSAEVREEQRQKEEVRKRKVTYQELADEYGITRRTAMRDIEILTASVPLETVPGNGGGVKVMDGWHSNRLYMSEDQKLLLIELRETLTGKKREIMESILTDFIMPIT